jgi:DNA polymerase III subunit alpha
LFGKDHTNFSNYIHPGQFLFIKGAVKNRFGQVDNYRFLPNYMELLSEIRAKFCKGIKVRINTKLLSPKIIDQLEETFVANKGNSNIYFQIFDSEERVSSESFSRKYKIDPNNELLAALDDLEGVEYKIVS